MLEWGEPWVRVVQPLPYVAVQQMIDAGNPWGINEYFKIDYLNQLSDEAIDVAVDKVADVESPFTQVIFVPLGGAIERSDRSAMALNLPDAKWFYFYLAMWFEPTHGGAEIQRARSFMEALRPWAAGTAPPNFISADEGHARLRASYGAETFERLVALKDKYDPDNVFSLNQNIPPSMTPV